MPVAMVPPPRGGLAFEMVVEFGVENTLGKRLLQLVEKPVLVENLFRVTAVQKLVQGVFLDRHKRPPSASLWAPHTRFLTVPHHTASSASTRPTGRACPGNTSRYWAEPA